MQGLHISWLPCLRCVLGHLGRYISAGDRALNVSLDTAPARTCARTRYISAGERALKVSLDNARTRTRARTRYISAGYCALKLSLDNYCRHVNSSDMNHIKSMMTNNKLIHGLEYCHSPFVGKSNISTPFNATNTNVSFSLFGNQYPLCCLPKIATVGALSRSCG